jgi:hypothetical protein
MVATTDKVLMFALLVQARIPLLIRIACGPYSLLSS